MQSRERESAVAKQIRLPDGYRVTHHPPSDEFPEGKKVLLPGQSRIRERLEARLEENKAAHEALHEQRRNALKAKQDAEKSKGVPADKRFV